LPPGCGHGDAANHGYLEGSGGLVLGLDGIEQSFEIGGVFAFEDEVAGGKPVLDAIEADGDASFRRVGAGAVFCALRRLAPIWFCVAIGGRIFGFWIFDVGPFWRLHGSRRLGGLKLFWGAERGKGGVFNGGFSLGTA